MTTIAIQSNFGPIPNNVPWRDTFAIPGSAVLLGATMHMQLRTSAASQSIALDMTMSNYLSLVDQANRIGGIHVDAASMLQVPPNTYVYDLVVSPANDDAFVAQTGTVTVTQGITR